MTQEEKEQKAREKQAKNRRKPITKVKHPPRTIKEIFSKKDKEPSKKKEFKKTLKKAKSGDAKAQYEVGRSYLNGLGGVKRNYKKAIDCLEKSSNQNYIPALNLLASCYQSGRGVEKSMQKAVRLFATAGSLATMERQKIYGVPQTKTSPVKTEDVVERVEQLVGNDEPAEKVAVNNSEPEDTQEQCDLAWAYFKGYGVEKSDEQAAYWWTKAAEQGHAVAQYKLGICYVRGEGVEQDYKKAVYWYQKSAEQGHSGAQYNLGVCYERGEGVEQDYKKAAYWYQKSAEQGYARGQNNLGGCYGNGWGVTQDYAQAAYWYQKSAEQGHARGQYNLGVCYDNGWGVTQDYVKAVYWYTKAAEQGNNSAQFNLAVSYYNGQGIAENKVKSKYWLQKAADQGDEKAKTALKELFK